MANIDCMRCVYPYTSTIWYIVLFIPLTFVKSMSTAISTPRPNFCIRIGRIQSLTSKPYHSTVMEKSRKQFILLITWRAYFVNLISYIHIKSHFCLIHKLTYFLYIGNEKIITTFIKAVEHSSDQR